MLHEIISKLKTIEHLPSHRVIKKGADEIISRCDLKTENGISKISDFIAHDPPLTMELLKIANSDAYGFRNKISSIRHALMILDNDLIRLIIEQHPMIPELEIYDKEVNNEFVRLLKHSIEVHEIADKILNILREKNNIEKNISDDLLSASVIHDIGLYFILIYFPAYYFKIFKKNRNIGGPLNQNEKNYLPDHSIIGSLLGEYWNFPPLIKKSIAFHHYPWAQDIHEGEDPNGAEILYVSDCLSDTFYSLFYDVNDVFTVMEHIATRKNLLGILGKLGIDISIIPEIKNGADDRIRKKFEILGI